MIRLIYPLVALVCILPSLVNSFRILDTYVYRPREISAAVIIFSLICLSILKIYHKKRYAFYGTKNVLIIVSGTLLSIVWLTMGYLTTENSHKVLTDVATLYTFLLSFYSIPYARRKISSERVLSIVLVASAFTSLVYIVMGLESISKNRIYDFAFPVGSFMLLPISLERIKSKSSLISILIWTLVFTVLLTNIFVTGKRLFILGAIVMLMLFLFQSTGSSYKNILRLFLMTIFIYTVYLYLPKNIMYNLFGRLGGISGLANERGLLSRYYQLSPVLNEWLKSPIIGVGFGGDYEVTKELSRYVSSYSGARHFVDIPWLGFMMRAGMIGLMMVGLIMYKTIYPKGYKNTKIYKTTLLMHIAVVVLVGMRIIVMPLLAFMLSRLSEPHQ